MAETKGIDNPVSLSHNDAKPSNVNEGDKNKNENQSRLHDEETHGTSGDIDEDTRIDEVKGPSVVQRVKEEVEAVAGAVVEAVFPKKN